MIVCERIKCGTGIDKRLRVQSLGHTCKIISNCFASGQLRFLTLLCLQSTPFNTDTQGATESFRIKWVELRENFKCFLSPVTKQTVPNNEVSVLRGCLRKAGFDCTFKYFFCPYLSVAVKTTG